jgi:hypothetical protein
MWSFSGHGASFSTTVFRPLFEPFNAHYCLSSCAYYCLYEAVSDTDQTSPWGLKQSYHLPMVATAQGGSRDCTCISHSRSAAVFWLTARRKDTMECCPRPQDFRIDMAMLSSPECPIQPFSLLPGLPDHQRIEPV